MAVPTGMQVQVRRSRHCKCASEGTIPVPAIGKASTMPLVSGSDAVCLFTSNNIQLHSSLPDNPININSAPNPTSWPFTYNLKKPSSVVTTQAQREAVNTWERQHIPLHARLRVPKPLNSCLGEAAGPRNCMYER